MFVESTLYVQLICLFDTVYKYTNSIFYFLIVVILITNLTVRAMRGSHGLLSSLKPSL